MSAQLAVELIMVAIALGALIATIVGMAGRTKRDLTRTLSKQYEATSDALAETKREADVSRESLRKEVGEAIGSLRQSVTDLGFFIRDNYVTDKVFAEAVTSIKDTIQVNVDRLDLKIQQAMADRDKGIDKLEKRMDRIENSH